MTTSRLQFSLAFIAFIIMLVFGVYNVRAQVLEAANTVDDPAMTQINQQIDAQKDKLEEINKKIEQYRSNIKAVQGQAASLKNQLLIIDNQVAKTNLDIEARQEEVKSVELEIERVKLEIAENEKLMQHNREQLASLIRLLSRYDDRSYLDVMLGNESFSDFFDQIKYSENIQTDLQKTVNRVQELVVELGRKHEDMSAKRTVLEDLLEALENEKAGLGQQKGEKANLIAQTKQSEVKFQTLIKDLQKEQAAANQQVAGLERQLRQKLEKKGAGEQFNNLGDAVLGWPTNFRRITALFHDADYPYRNLFEHSGLDIGVPLGTPLYAAESGYVARAISGTKWYGNYVMIIHSNNLSTLYAHMNSLNVVTDQYVNKGQLIGYSGTSGFSSGPHLHFEVRLNGIPVNPQSYLP